MSGLFPKTASWLEERIGLGDLIKRTLTGYGIPARATGLPFCLGGLAILFFLSQLLTGILLLVHYVPTSAGAFHSVERITLEVPFGWFIRGLHSFGATTMIIAVMLHALRVFFFAEYKNPRELHWVTGMILLLLTLFLAFSGYLLPWTQLSYWGSTVGTETLRDIPLIGEQCVQLVRGGTNVGEPTLHRFFALHVVILPLAFLGLFGIHIYFVRRTGQGGPPTIRPGEPKYPFFPNHVAKELLVFAIVLFVLTLLIIFWPEVREEPADPFNTPKHIKPEWYFLPSYQFLKIVSPKWFALLLQGLAVMVLVLWPFLDRSEERDIRKRPLLLAFSILAILVVLGLGVWGHYS